MPNAVEGDQASVHAELQRYLSNSDISSWPVPSQKRQKNNLEPKHGIISSIFFRLKSASLEENSGLLAPQTITTSIDLYKSDGSSASELAKGFSKPIDGKSKLQPVPQEIMTV